VGIVFGQQHPLPKLTLKSFHPVPRLSASTLSASPVLPLFTFTVKSSRDHNIYSGAIVGNSPFNHGGDTVNVHTQIVPVVIVTERVATAINSDEFLSTARGVATSDPTKADNLLDGSQQPSSATDAAITDFHADQF